MGDRWADYGEHRKELRRLWRRIGNDCVNRLHYNADADEDAVLHDAY